MKMKTGYVSVVVLLLVLGPIPLFAETAPLAADGYVSYPKNNGTPNVLTDTWTSRVTNQDLYAHGIIEFDISSVPAGLQILS